MTQIGLDGNLSINLDAYDNPAFTDAIKDIAPQVYRTPGSMACGDGKTPEGYHWRNDHPTLEQVKKMWDKAKPKMIYVANMVDKGIRNNLSMLQHAAMIGLPIDYIELGNEFNIYGSIGRQLYPTVDDYAKTCLEWWKVIKQDFPNITPLLVGENKGYLDTVHWNKSCLQYMPDAMLVWHYHTPGYYVFDGVPNVDIMRACVDENFEEVFADVPINRIAMTEFSLEQGEHETRENPTFKNGDAEYLATQTLLQKFTEIGLPLACYHNVVGADGKGAIVSSRFGTWIEPAGRAIKDFLQ